jgi:hypothetical protein
MARFLLAFVTFVYVATYGTAMGVEGARVVRVSATPASAKAAAPVKVAVATATPEAPAKKPPKKKAARAPKRRVFDGTKRVFARVAGVALRHPSDRVERVGFHQASDPKSLNMTPAGAGIRWKTMPSRFRPTSRHTAVDIVVDPRNEIRAPVSGIVKKAGQYSLYCKALDNFVIISPDGHPELEVKILHISGRSVRAGDRVVAGKTVIATKPTKLPFGSQVDAYTAKPAWPHVHIEATKLDVPSAKPVLGTATLAFSTHCG